MSNHEVTKSKAVIERGRLSQGTGVVQAAVTGL